MKWLAIAVTLATLAGCGYVGDTKPPTLDIPARVTDLRALQFGDQVLVEFTLPAFTTEGLLLVKAEEIELQAQSGAGKKSYQIPPQAPGAVRFEFKASEWPNKQIALAVRATGPKKKAADWSSTITLTLGPALAIPTNLTAESASEGLRLKWKGPGPHYRILRAGSTGDAAPVGDSTKEEFVDANTAFGTEYRYFVQTIASDTYQGLPSAAVTIIPLDRFAPAVPMGLGAVAGPASIELSWERNSEEDFAGYNIYRASGDGEFTKIAGPIDAPAYSDPMIESGKRYRYAIGALDRTGNESALSMAAEALAQ